MSELEFILDPSFLITWFRFRHRDLLKKIDARYYILEDFFDVFSTGAMIRHLRENLGKLFRIIDYSEAEISDAKTSIYKAIEEDERLCMMSGLAIKILAVAVTRDLRILSDSFCFHKFAMFYWNPSMVWSSYDLLKYMSEEGIIEDLKNVLKDFSEDTNTVLLRISRTENFETLARGETHEEKTEDDDS